jgi:ADP-heptose:LPS heptosyltransferase
MYSGLTPQCDQTRALAMPEAAILIIKLGALGNVILSMNAFAAIRAHHGNARISLLTTAPYAGWLRQAPWFDEVLVDERPRWWDLSGLHRLHRMLTAPGFIRVYDLQTSSRSSHYFRLFPRAATPEWSGIASGCSLPDRDPNRGQMHDHERLISQLRQAGIERFPPADLSWCRGDIGRFGLKRDFVVLVPGSAPHRPVKRWPAAHYQALARTLREQGLTPVVVGSAAETPIARAIPAAVDLTGQTSFGDLADLGRSARFAVGNDTGPMHLLAAVSCPSVVLFSRDSEPALCAPRGPDVRVLRRPGLASLTVETVLAGLPHPVTA